MTPQQRYYYKNKERLLQESRERYAQNIEAERKRSKIYKENNSEKIRNNRNALMKRKRKLDSSFRLKSNVSRLIRRALQKKHTSKRGLSFLKFVNYNMNQLKAHLESLFEPWMSWDNWGVYSARDWDDNNPATWTWQIDHVIPQSSLVYTSMEDANFKKCWSLDNLRPFSAKANFLKGNK